MPLSTHVLSICQYFNQERSNLPNVHPSVPLKRTHVYDLLATSCGLSKFKFDHIGFIATSIMREVDTYHPSFDDKITQALIQEISKKIALEDRFYCGQLAFSLAHAAFHFDDIKLRHPDQLLVMLEELYLDATLALENLDDIIALIESLEVALDKKGKFRDGKTYLILHWCYATVKVHESEIHKRCDDSKIPAKRQALLNVYKPYIDIAVAKAEKWFNHAVSSNEPAAMELKQRLENRILSESYNERSHPFVEKDLDFLSYDSNKYKGINPFKNQWTYPRVDPFEKNLNTIHANSNSDLEFATTAYLYRMFKRDMLGLVIGDYHDLGFDNSYRVLYSDSFMRRLMEDYPTLTKSDLHIADLNAQKQFNDMFRHYLSFSNFENYKILSLVHPAAGA